MHGNIGTLLSNWHPAIVLRLHVTTSGSMHKLVGQADGAPRILIRQGGAHGCLQQCQDMLPRVWRNKSRMIRAYMHLDFYRWGKHIPK